MLSPLNIARDLSSIPKHFTFSYKTCISASDFFQKFSENIFIFQNAKNTIFNRKSAGSRSFTRYKKQNGLLPKIKSPHWTINPSRPSVIQYPPDKAASVIEDMNKNEKSSVNWLSFHCVSAALSSRTASRRVFSALHSLTSVFGMGTGGPYALWTLTSWCTFRDSNPGPTD